MKRLTIALVVMAVAFLGNAVFGQEAAGIPDEIIKELDGLVGTWTVEGQDRRQGADRRVHLPVGYELRTRRRCCLRGRVTYTTTEMTRAWRHLLGWNAAKNCIEDRGFDANGGNARLLWTVKSPTEHGKGTCCDRSRMARKSRRRASSSKRGHPKLLWSPKVKPARRQGLSSARSRRNPRRKTKRKQRKKSRSNSSSNSETVWLVSG